jgi:alkylated DNA nucleotide flippase Atl1
MARTPATSRFQGLPHYARRVLDVVDAIPAGRVMAYGDIAEWLGEGGPRQVATVMATYGQEVPWHRVLRADGTCAAQVAMRQLPLLRDEGVPTTKRYDRIQMSAARWDPRERFGEPPALKSTHALANN